VLGIDPASIDEHLPFVEYGLGSSHLVRACAAIEEKLGQPISPVLSFEHPTLQALSRALSSAVDAMSAKLGINKSVGRANRDCWLGCRFPGASTPENFWQLLTRGAKA